MLNIQRPGGEALVVGDSLHRFNIDNLEAISYSAERGPMLLAALEQVKTRTASDTDTDTDTDDDDDDDGGGAASSGAAAVARGAEAQAPKQSIEVQSLNVKIVNQIPEPENAYVSAPRGSLHAGRSTKGAPWGSLHEEIAHRFLKY